MSRQHTLSPEVDGICVEQQFRSCSTQDASLTANLIGEIVGIRPRFSD